MLQKSCSLMIRMTCTLTKQGQFCLLLPSLVVKSDPIKGGTRLCLAGTRSALVIDWYCRQRMERTLLVLLLVTVAFAIVAEGKHRCSFSLFFLSYSNSKESDELLSDTGNTCCSCAVALSRIVFLTRSWIWTLDVKITFSLPS